MLFFFVELFHVMEKFLNLRVSKIVFYLLYKICHFVIFSCFTKSIILECINLIDNLSNLNIISLIGIIKYNNICISIF